MSEQEPREDVEARRALARKFLVAQARALNTATASGPLARVARRTPPPVARWTDRWVELWYRWTYCTRHGHRFPNFGSPLGGVDDYCGNCGKNRSSRKPRRSCQTGSDGASRPEKGQP